MGSSVRYALYGGLTCASVGAATGAQFPLTIVVLVGVFGGAIAFTLIALATETPRKVFTESLWGIFIGGLLGFLVASETKEVFADIPAVEGALLGALFLGLAGGFAGALLGPVGIRVGGTLGEIKANLSNAKSKNWRKRLKQASTEERTAIVGELAEEKSIEELMQILDGVGPRPISWKTIWLPLPTRYTLSEQLIAVDALAQTGSKQALDHLKSIVDNVIVVKPPGSTVRAVMVSGQNIDQELIFNRARGPLREVLETMNYEELDCTSTSSKEGKRAYEILKKAIEQLKASLRH